MTAIWMGLRHGTVEGRLIPGERSAILRQGACCDRDRGGNCRGDKSDASHVLLPPPSEVGPTPVPHVEPVSFRTRVDGKPAEPSPLKGSLAGAHRVGMTWPLSVLVTCFAKGGQRLSTSERRWR